MHLDTEISGKSRQKKNNGKMTYNFRSYHRILQNAVVAAVSLPEPKNICPHQTFRIFPHMILIH